MSVRIDNRGVTAFIEVRASWQHGVVTRSEAKASGLSERSIDLHLRRLRWSARYPGGLHQTL